MLRRWLCQAEVTLRLTPVDPILIKSGYATLDEADMVPVSTFRGADRVYYFPGTSLKGVLRSHLERVARTLRPGSVCLPYYEPRGRPPVPVPSETGSVGCGHRVHRSRAADTSAEAYADSCAACRTFGSQKFGGRLSIGDAYPLEGHSPQTEQRNGVGIDRFTGGTVPRALFDFVVLVGGVFETQLRLVNFETWQLAALGLLLIDLRDELIQIGSGRSRGLGRIRGEVVSYRLNYLPRTQQLCGLHDMATAEERDLYALAPWTPPRPIPLPSPRARGLRREYDLTATWTDTLADLVPAFEQFLAWQGGLKGTPAAVSTGLAMSAREGD
jgi:CRISPR/Cas system CSM-associated protein Csm3 (group 7 of RAMP superfamily)